MFAYTIGDILQFALFTVMIVIAIAAFLYEKIDSWINKEDEK